MGVPEVVGIHLDATLLDMAQASGADRFPGHAPQPIHPQTAACPCCEPVLRTLRSIAMVEFRDYKRYVSDADWARSYSAYQKKYVTNPRESDKKSARLVLAALRNMPWLKRPPVSSTSAARRAIFCVTCGNWRPVRISSAAI